MKVLEKKYLLPFILVTSLFARMPEGKDETKQASLINTFSRLAKNKKYIWGVVAQFFYVGAQIGVWSFTIRLVMKELGYVEAQAATLYLISIIGFCASRFVYTWLMKYVAPVRLLAAGSVLSAVCALVVVMAGGWVAVIALVLISAFMSLMFPTIYGIALGSLNENDNEKGEVKIGASGLIMAILGGALITPLQGMVSDATGSINVSYLVPFGCFVVVMMYAIMCLLKHSLTVRSAMPLG